MQKVHTTDQKEHSSQAKYVWDESPIEHNNEFGKGETLDLVEQFIC
jgi:hypothetical protein